MLEQRLDDQNYDGLTKLTNRKDETKKKNDDVNDVSIADAKLHVVVDTDINNTNNDTVHDNDNNRSNERIDHDIQNTSGDRNGLLIINYCDDNESNRITPATKKPIYNSYKDVCMNNNITHRRDNITHAGNENVTHEGTPPVSSE